MKKALVILAVLAFVATWALMPTTRVKTPGPNRIAAIAPSIASTLRAFGLEDHIVVRHGYDRVTKRPSAGDQAGIDLEVLVSQKPTHVYTSFQPTDPTFFELAATFDWHVRDLRALALHEVYTFIDTLWSDMRDAGLVEGDCTHTERLRESLERRIDFDGTVLLLSLADPFGGMGPGSYHHEILLELGLTPAVTEGAPWITYDHEDLLTLAPDVVVFMGAESSLRTLRRLDIPASREGRIVTLDDPEYLVPSPRLADFADDLVRSFEGWTTSDAE